MNSGTTSGGADKLVSYASIFLYQPKLKAEYAQYTTSISSFEGKLTQMTQ
jgi:hypothetical protein